MSLVSALRDPIEEDLNSEFTAESAGSSEASRDAVYPDNNQVRWSVAKQDGSRQMDLW